MSLIWLVEIAAPGGEEEFDVSPAAKAVADGHGVNAASLAFVLVEFGEAPEFGVDLGKILHDVRIGVLAEDFGPGSEADGLAEFAP